MKNFFVVFIIFRSIGLHAQGVLNNGGNIVLNGGLQLVINGNYTNQNSGLIKNAVPGATISLNGNWINNASNVAFDNDGTNVLLNGVNQIIGGTQSTAFYNLSLQGSGIKTLNVNTAVGGILTTTGVLTLVRPLDLNSRTLTISNPATSAITATSGYIVSETNAAINPSIVAWKTGTSTGQRIVPFGVSGTQIPFTFDKTSSGAADFSVSTRATLSADNTPWANTVSTMASSALGISNASGVSVIDRWWNIDVTAPVTANLVFSYRGLENSTTLNPTGNFSAQRWNGTAWEPQTGSGIGVTSGTGTVAATGVSSFTSWILSSTTSGPLPVILTGFSVSCENKDQINVFWQTASEQNSEKFRIEKSRDLVSWILASEVKAAGNSSTEIQYKITDKNQWSGTSYYRLVQVDFNGLERLYDPVSISCNAEENSLNLFPNPSTGKFTLEIRSQENLGNTIIEILDLSGKLVGVYKYDIYSGINHIIFDESEFQSGSYFLRILSSVEFNPVKMVLY